jgi:hypothetical protein
VSSLRNIKRGEIAARAHSNVTLQLVGVISEAQQRLTQDRDESVRPEQHEARVQRSRGEALAGIARRRKFLPA